jgi:hypothetical protein
MDQTRRDVMRRNLFRAGVGVTTAVAAKVLTHRAEAQTAANAVPTPVPPKAYSCFLKGTRTIEGEKAIEELQIDERLVVSLAGTAPVASIIRWRGAVTPIRIRAGAIDEDRRPMRTSSSPNITLSSLAAA